MKKQLFILITLCATSNLLTYTITCINNSGETVNVVANIDKLKLSSGTIKPANNERSLFKKQSGKRVWDNGSLIADNITISMTKNGTTQSVKLNLRATNPIINITAPNGILTATCEGATTCEVAKLT